MSITTNMSLAFSQLEEVYQAVNQEVSKTTAQCQMCGKCCNFATNGLRLYISYLERLYLKHHCGGLVLIEGKCSALKQGKCSIHKWRPLGCRTQFCKITLDELYEKYYRCIIDIEKEFALDYNYSEAFQ